VILAHFTGQDGPSTALVLGLAFVAFGGRRVLRGERGWRARGVRWVALGVGLLAVGVGAGLR
jgi:hypothetical protein